MKRALALLMLIPVVAFAQAMVDLSHLAALCRCSYDCNAAGARGLVNATCVNIDGGTCVFPAWGKTDGGSVTAVAVFSYEGACYKGPTLSGYATAEGCALSACYYNVDGGTCGSTPF